MPDQPHPSHFKSDRTVHATLAGGDLIVRLDRAGKWYRESEGQRFPISFGFAVRMATERGSTIHLGRPGGKRFDAAVRPAVEAAFGGAER